jgi:hypothetical protein
MTKKTSTPSFISLSSLKMGENGQKQVPLVIRKLDPIWGIFGVVQNVSVSVTRNVLERMSNVLQTGSEGSTFKSLPMFAAFSDVKNDNRIFVKVGKSTAILVYDDEAEERLIEKKDYSFIKVRFQDRTKCIAASMHILFHTNMQTNLGDSAESEISFAKISADVALDESLAEDGKSAFELSGTPAPSKKEVKQLEKAAKIESEARKKAMSVQEKLQKKAAKKADKIRSKLTIKRVA